MERQLHSLRTIGFFVGISLLAGACGPTQPPPTQAPAAPKTTSAATGAPAAAAKSEAKPAQASAEWDKIVEAARQEGKIVIGHSSLESNGRITDAFKAKHPWIDVERAGMAASVFAPRVLAEQRQGLYAWDLLLLTGFNSTERVLAPAGAVGDIRPFLEELPAEIKDDSKWAGGFMWLRNPNSPDSIVTDMNVGFRVWINRAMVPASELSSVDQILDPKFKGKITIYRPAQSSAGSQALANLLANKDEAFVRKILFDQEPVIVDNQRQSSEWVIQGRYPIGLGVTADSLSDFKAQGLGTAVEPLKEPATTGTSVSGVTLLKNPPHPNATKVFLAWFLSKEGQDAYNELGGPDSSSRRMDAKVVNPDSTPDWRRLQDYKLVLGTPSGDAFLDKVIAIASEKG